MKKHWLIGAGLAVFAFNGSLLAQQYPYPVPNRADARLVRYQEDLAMELEPETAQRTSQRVSQQLRAQYQPPAGRYPVLQEGPSQLQGGRLPSGGMVNSPQLATQQEMAPGPLEGYPPVMPTPAPDYSAPYTTPTPGTANYQNSAGCGACGTPACGCDSGYDMYGRGGFRGRQQGRMFRGSCDSGCGIGTMGAHQQYIGGQPDAFVDGGCDSGCGYGQDCGGCGAAGCLRSGLGLLERGCGTYTVVGASWLLLKRDGADFQPLSYENGMPGNQLSISDANLGAQSGFETFFARQNNEGRGWEIRYWGLSEQDNFAQLTSMPRTEYGGFSTISVGGWGNAWDLYNNADVHQIARESDLHNIEFNFLRYASSCGPCNNIVFRGIAGLRVIRFNDSLAYSAYSTGYFGGSTFESLKLHSSVANTLVAAQIGGTGEYCLTNRFRLALGSKVGFGGNSIDADQCLVTANGIYGTNAGGNDYSYSNSTSDFAMFGEFNTNLYYHVTDSCRVSVGYRLFGISGVALSQDQIPYDFTDTNEINSIKRDGGLLLHGLTIGAEFCH